MSGDDPTPEQIRREILIYAAIVIAVGVAFVAVQVHRKGTWILWGPRTPPADTDR